MKLLRITVTLFFIFLIGNILSPSCKEELPEIPLIVGAFYYQWYGTPEVTGAWRHWNEGGHNPDNIDENGQRDIGTTNYPYYDVFDSQDIKTIFRHLEESIYSGINLLISSWWGIGSFEDKGINLLLSAIEKGGYDIKATIYYEYIPNNNREMAINDLNYIVKTYGRRDSFFKVNGEPVIFIYGRACSQISLNDWEYVISKVEESTKVFISFDWPLDTTNFNLPSNIEAVHFYNPVGDVVNGKDMKSLYSKFTKNTKKAGLYSAITVIPGYDDSNIGRENPIVADRKNGSLYKSLWEYAISANPNWILITSFNEWHEGSEIEPSIEYQDQYLLLTQYYSEEYKSD